MSLVRSHYLRSSSKWLIHLLHFLPFVRDAMVSDPLAFTFIHYQTPTERIRTSSTRFWKHTHYALARFEEAKNDENDFAFAITPVLSNGDEKTASLDAFKKVDSNVKLFGSTIEAKKWTTYPGFFAKGGLDIMTSFLLDSIFEEDKSSSALKEDVYGDTKKPPKRVMDFCCGSGIIGYALRHSRSVVKRRRRGQKRRK